MEEIESYFNPEPGTEIIGPGDPEGEKLIIELLEMLKKIYDDIQEKMSREDNDRVLEELIKKLEIEIKQFENFLNNIHKLPFSQSDKNSAVNQAENKLEKAKKFLEDLKEQEKENSSKKLHNDIMIIEFLKKLIELIIKVTNKGYTTVGKQAKKYFWKFIDTLKELGVNLSNLTIPFPR